MEPINSQDQENLKALKNSKEYLSLDKLIKIRLNNLKEACIQSHIDLPDNNLYPLKCANQADILQELLDTIDEYSKEQEEDG